MAGVLRVIDERQLLEQLGWVRTLAVQLLRDPDRAEDLSQEVCRVALESPPRTSGGPRMRAWFRSVTRLLARDTIRSQRNRSIRERRAAGVESAPSTYEVVARNALVQRVSIAVMALPEPYRSTVLYRYFDGLAPAKIAELMAVSGVTARKRLSRGLQMLRARLRQSGVTDSHLRALFSLPASAAIATKAASTGVVMTIIHQKAVIGLIVLSGAGMAYGVLRGGAPESTGRPDAQVARASRMVGAGAILAPSTAELQDPPRVPLPPETAAPAESEPVILLGSHNGEPVTLDTDRLAQNLADGLETAMEPEAIEVLPDGYRVETHASGTRSAAGMVELGARAGVWNEWHEDGSAAAEGSYVHGKRHGTWTYWYDNGQVRLTGDYVYGSRDGPWVEYAEGGARLSETTYRDGKKYGTERRWVPGGKLRSETSWLADVRQGPAVTWYDNGQVASRGRYQAGVPTGAWEFWHEDGSVDTERKAPAPDKGEGGG